MARRGVHTPCARRWSDRTAQSLGMTLSRILRALALALAAACTCAAQAVAPLAGSVIENMARATYFDADRGFNTNIVSNTVQATVQPREALTLTSDISLARPAGGLVTLAHRLTNTGNASSNFVLSVANQAGDDFDLLGLRLTLDRNGNGRADAGEPLVANGDTLGPLAPGESLDLVLTGKLPSGLPVDRVARLTLSARSTLQGLQSAVLDTVTVADGALPQVFIAASTLAPRPGEAVSFDISASNNGNRPMAGVAVSVDGVAMSLSVLRDEIPVNTSFLALGPAGEALPLYHLLGQPINSYSSVAPADLSKVDAVAFGFAAPVQPGETVARRLSVRLNANASGPTLNQARLWYSDAGSAAPQATDSNTVLLSLAPLPPSLRLYADAQYAKPLTALSAGQPFYAAIDGAQCNTDPGRAERHTLSVSAQLSGDVEHFVATETAANSGVFRVEPQVPTRDAVATPAVSGDGLLSVLPNDKLTMSLQGCGTTLMEASVLVDPFGVVFDSKTDALVAGATVTLIDVTGAGNGGLAGGLARVFLADGLTRAPSVLVTGAAGHYQFPLVAPSVYRLQVQPPGEYSFPSQLSPGLLPPGRSVDVGSFGEAFTITALTPPVHLDLPVDASAQSGFFIEKMALRKTVTLGETLDYNIKIRNVSGQLLGRVRLNDQLPAGFSYQVGSARLNGGSRRYDGSALPEPEGGAGPALVFNLGAIDDQAVMTLSYRVRVGPGALQGDANNHAQASTAPPLARLSNRSSAAVQVLAGVFSERAYLVGNVYADCNRNGQRDDDEPGLPGVRLYLQDGTHVSTDAQGRYSLYGLRAQTQVLKLDTTSLPVDGLVLALLSNRNAGDGGSRFVDLKAGELHRADFAVTACDEPLRLAIAARAQALTSAAERGDALQTAQLAADPRQAPPVDPRSLPASGVVGARAGAVAGLAAPGAGATAPAVAAAAAAAAAAARTPAPAALDEAPVADLDNGLAILSPTSGQVLAYAQTAIRAKGPLDATLTLSVNGLPLAQDRIGRHSQLESAQLQVLHFVGIDLRPGSNALLLTQTGADGQLQAQVAFDVIAPGALARLRLSSAAVASPADGRSVQRVLLEALDSAGVAVTVRTAVTLDASLARWRTADLNPDEPGVQIFLEGGRAELELLAPAEPGDALLSARSGQISTQLSLGFLPELRPLIAAGLVEGVIGLRRFDSKALQPARAQDGFEQTLRRLSAEFDNGRGTAHGRAALFLKGKVLGEALLTLAYDSDKDTRERLFRDIQPGEFYPVYGDDSSKGFDAQSTSRAYVRIDQGRSFALYGDFNTQAQPTLAAAQPGASTDGASPGAVPDERRLGQYNRSLTGVKSRVEAAEGRVALTSFASHGSTRQVIDELPARGVSGPYLPSRPALVANSERVEILTRDRNQPSTILKSRLLTRFSDYELDGLGQGILLRSALPTLDEGFNPHSLRVTYEVESGGAAFWVGGADATLRLDEALTLGASLVRDTDPLGARALVNIGLTARLSPQTLVTAELARTETAAAEALQGGALRVALRHDAPGLQAQAQWVRADAGFDNPGAAAAKGRAEATASASYTLDTRSTLKAELVSSQDSVAHSSRWGAQLGLEHSLGDGLRAELGLRLRQDSGTPSTVAAPVQPVGAAPVAAAISPSGDGASLRAKLRAQVPGMAQASVFAELEQDVQQGSQRMAALGGEYRLGNGSRLYARHEFISSLGDRYALNGAQQRNASVLGLQTETVQDGNLFSEYRLRDALSGREAEAAIGLRNRWALGGGLWASTGFERVHSLSGKDSAESTAVAGGLDYTGSADWKGALRLEWRGAASSETLLGTAGIAYKINPAWTALGKNLLSVAHNRGGVDKLDEWLQLGLAYREPGANQVNALLRADLRHEQLSENASATPAADAFVSPASQRDVASLSAHLSVQHSPRLLLSGRAAAKWAMERSMGIATASQTQLLGGRATYDLDSRWDLGLQAGVLLNAGARARQYGLGLELGRLLGENLWLSVGWNLFGYSDKDLTAQDYTQPGVYLRLRWKFDEKTLRSLGDHEWVK